MKKTKKWIKNRLGTKNRERFFFLFRLIKYLRKQTRRIFRDLGSDGRSELLLPSEEYFIEDKNVFFGYYDKSPFSDNGEVILVQVAKGQNKHPQVGDELIVGFFCRQAGSSGRGIVELGRTTTWCWQQGCRLQWFPGDGSKKIIYNKLINKRFSSVVQDTESKRVVKSLSFPVYDVDPSGSCALTLSFSRLYRLRPGYGYAGIIDETIDEKIPSSDGIWLGNIKKNEKSLLLSLEKISQMDWNEKMVGAQHYVNFISYNKDGSKFAFLHVWEGGEGRSVRLMIFDFARGELSVVGQGHEMVSHYSWIDDSSIIFTSLAKKGYGIYYTYNTISKETIVVGGNELTGDGHPSACGDSSLFITDTSADEYGERKLILFDGLKGKKRELFRLVDPIGFWGEVRCDFHPRWDSSGRYVCIDCPVSGKRRMSVFDLSVVLRDFS
ncbi:MAG: hypothetical protein U9O20_00470 [Patescibacteria group bacterium]|nr:hypothetical protein [Patescibacteria group bacterium]